MNFDGMIQEGQTRNYSKKVVFHCRFFRYKCHLGVKYLITECKITWLNASHKSNPSTVPQGYVETCILGHVGGVNRCEWDNL